MYLRNVDKFQPHHTALSSCLLSWESETPRNTICLSVERVLTLKPTRDSPVGPASRLRAGQPKNRGSTFRPGKIYFSPPDEESSSVCVRIPFPTLEAWSWSLTSSANFKNEWRYSSNPPYAVMVSIGTAVAVFGYVPCAGSPRRSVRWHRWPTHHNGKCYVFVKHARTDRRNNSFDLCTTFKQCITSRGAGWLVTDKNTGRTMHWAIHTLYLNTFLSIRHPGE